MASGGFRVGAGRKKGSKDKKPRKGAKYKKKSIEPAKPAPKTAKPIIKPEDLEAQEYLRAVWNDPGVETSLRIRAAEIVLRSGPAMGKKDELNERARTAGAGRFGAGRAPLALIKSLKSRVND